MFNKRKFTVISIIGCLLVIALILLTNYSKLFIQKDTDSNKQTSASVTIIEKNDETENKEDTTNESKPLEDNKENKVDNESPIGELGVQCTLVRLDDDSDEKLESISTIFAIDKNIKTIQKEHIEKIHKTVTNGLVTESIVLNKKINSHTIDEIKEIKTKDNGEAIFLVRGKVNGLSYMTMYTSQTMEGKGIIDNLKEEYGMLGDVLNAINSTSEKIFNDKMNEMEEKFNNWHGSIGLTYIQADGKSDSIDALVSVLEIISQMPKK